WLLGRVDRVLVSGPAEADACIRAGLSREQLAIVPPGVEVRSTGFSRFRLKAGLQTDVGPCIACVGPLEPHKGFYEALWAFDTLRFLYNGLRLFLIGAGSDRPRLARFVRVLKAEDQVHWLGQPDDVR